MNHDYLIPYEQKDTAKLEQVILSDDFTFLEKYKELRCAYVHFDITQEQYEYLFNMLTNRG